MASIIETFKQAGQGHVFAFFDKLAPDAQKRLLEEAAEIDLGEVDRLVASLVKKSNGAACVDISDLSPAPYVRRPEFGGPSLDWASAKTAGEQALRAGRVAAFTVAGGQGTRLGYDGPKGTFKVTPVRQASLFQVFAEKLQAAGKRYGKPLHWFIMTSHQNHAATESFFIENKFFGLGQQEVHFFRQGRMPAVDFNGKIILESTGSIAMSPDGHGGSLRALERSGSLDLMQREGIDTLSYFQVDNPLVRFIDPAFIGWHLLNKSELSSKMIPKAYAEEKVGHFCMQRGKMVVIEYSDLPMAMQKEIDASNGQLRYLAGSVAIHVFDREFIRRMAAGGDAALPFHRADKKIPTIDAAGAAVKPEKANGVKFEMFAFDAIPFAKNPIIIEALRQDDFSPVKNAEGLDSPKSCREDLLRQYSRWLLANGAGIQTDTTGLPSVNFEVTPGFGYDEDSFATSWKSLKTQPAITNGCIL